jgi:hypothetical protein
MLFMNDCKSSTCSFCKLEFVLDSLLRVIITIKGKDKDISVTGRGGP